MSRSSPPPKPEDADFPGPPPSLDLPDGLATAKPSAKPAAEFPEIDAAIRIVDVDSRPLERRPTALNPWNIKTPGLGVEATAALDALKDVRRPTAVGVEALPRRRLFVLLAVATVAAIAIFATIIAVALLRRGSAPAELSGVQIKLPEVPVGPQSLDEAARLAKRAAMIAAFDRHDFSQGIAIGEELEAARVLDAEAEFWLADACRHSNRLVEALRRYEAFIRDHPEHKFVDAAHYYAAEVARQDGQLDTARAHYKAVAADDKSGLRSKAKKRLASLK